MWKPAVKGEWVQKTKTLQSIDEVLSTVNITMCIYLYFNYLVYVCVYISVCLHICVSGVWAWNLKHNLEDLILSSNMEIQHKLSILTAAAFTLWAILMA